MSFEGNSTEVQPAVPSHTEESHPHIQVDEQGNEMVHISEKNNAVLKNAEHINLMPLEELALLSDAERIAMLKTIRWDEFAKGEEKVPEEVLEAESKIYSTYEPSERLQKAHQEANDAAISSIGTPKELFSLKMKWPGLSDDEKITFINRYVAELNRNYHIPTIVATLYKVPFNNESAMFLDTDSVDTPGTMLIYESTTLQSSFDGVLTSISHEMAHGFQAALRKNLSLLPKSEELNSDARWFNASREQQLYRREEEYKRSFKRYENKPTEKDAWKMQDYAQDKVRNIIDEYTEKILKEHGLPPLSTIDAENAVSQWVNRTLNAGIKAEELIPEAERKLAKAFSERIRQIYGGKTEDEIRSIMTSAIERKKQADSLLQV